MPACPLMTSATKSRSLNRSRRGKTSFAAMLSLRKTIELHHATEHGAIAIAQEREHLFRTPRHFVLGTPKKVVPFYKFGPLLPIACLRRTAASPVSLQGPSENTFETRYRRSANSLHCVPLSRRTDYRGPLTSGLGFKLRAHCYAMPRKP